jgi:hypothetical protein
MIGFETQNSWSGQSPTHLDPPAGGGNAAWHVLPMQAQSVMTQFVVPGTHVTAIGWQVRPEAQTPWHAVPAAFGSHGGGGPPAQPHFTNPNGSWLAKAETSPVGL